MNDMATFAEAEINDDYLEENQEDRFLSADREEND